MTSKEKAEELVTKMQLDWGCNCCYNDWAKECALVAVDEILKEINDISFLIDCKIQDEVYMYWESVKKAIEKL